MRFVQCSVLHNSTGRKAKSAGVNDRDMCVFPVRIAAKERNEVMKKIMPLSRWAGAVLLCSLVLLPNARGQDCPCSWYDAVPPNPDWGLPPTVGEMFPFHYYASEEAKAFFLVPLKGLESLLPPGVAALDVTSPNSPWRELLGDWQGFGLLGLVFYENNSNQYGQPFNLGQVWVIVDDPSWSGFFVVYPVAGVTTSEAMQWWGMAAFGWPQIIGDAHFQWVKPHGVKAFASADGELIFSVEMSIQDLAPQPTPPMVILSTKEGFLTRAVFFPTAESHDGSWTIGGSTVRLGHHPIAQQLRAMGLGEFPSIGQVVRSKYTDVRLERGSCSPLPGLGSN